MLLIVCIVELTHESNEHFIVSTARAVGLCADQLIPYNPNLIASAAVDCLLKAKLKSWQGSASILRTKVEARINVDQLLAQSIEV
jgi:hypothetical protein